MINRTSWSSARRCFKQSATARRKSSSCPLQLPVTYIHSGLSHPSQEQPPLPYPRGHAWLHAFLHERLQYQRMLRDNKQGFSNENTTNSKLARGSLDRVLLFEHDHVYTLGRGADENHLVFLSQDEDSANKDGIQEQKSRLSRKARGPTSARLSATGHCFINNVTQQICRRNDGGPFCLAQSTCNTTDPVRAPNHAPIYRVERGGEVTYHGPGQLVVYPMVDLRRAPYRPDLHWFLRQVEEVLIRTLKVYGVEGVRDDVNTGVWVNRRKIAAVGISSSRWITTHGFALNVHPNLDYFDTSIVIPCGVETQREVTSLWKELQKQNKAVEDVLPNVEQVAQVVLKEMQEVFGVEMRVGSRLEE